MLIDQTYLRDLILQAKRVSRAVEEAQSFKGRCIQMGKQVCHISQFLNTLSSFITLNPMLLTYLNPNHCVITEASDILQEALTLACSCERKTILYRLIFTGQKSARFRNLYHVSDFFIANMNWLLILYNPGFGDAFNDIRLSLPQTLSHDSSVDLSALSRVATGKIICKLETMLTSGASSFELKICCVEALPVLNVGNSISSGMIEPEKTVGGLMLGLGKLVETECCHAVQYKCLMSIAEITAAAESNPDLRSKVFKGANSHATKAIVEQLLRVIKESDREPTLQVLAIRSIGFLARIFRKGDKHVISVLVSQLGNRLQEVEIEALVALQKFVCLDNFLRKEHLKTIIELDAIQQVMKLLRDVERTQKTHALELICYLAINEDYSENMEEARVRTALQQHILTTKEGSSDSELKELVSKALWYLTLYYKF